MKYATKQNAYRAALAERNVRTKAKYVPNVCAKPYCYKPRWRKLSQCRAHILAARKGMNRLRARKRTL